MCCYSDNSNYQTLGPAAARVSAISEAQSKRSSRLIHRQNSNMYLKYVNKLSNQFRFRRFFTDWRPVYIPQYDVDGAQPHQYDSYRNQPAQDGYEAQ